MTSLLISSPAFDDGGPIPDRYGYTESNVNPPLDIENVPADAASLALVVDDPDAKEPAGKVWTHWLVWNIDPERSEIPEGWSPEQAIEGQNDYGEQGYGGPNPPDRVHRYRFRLYALDTVIDVSPAATKDELIDVMTGLVVEKGRYDGTYAP